MVNILLDHKLFLSNDVVTVLKTFLENFANNGLGTVQGGNTVFSIK